MNSENNPEKQDDQKALKALKPSQNPKMSKSSKVPKASKVLHAAYTAPAKSRLVDELAAGRPVIRPTSGDSMEPMLKENRTQAVIVRPDSPLRIDDVVLFRRPNGAFVLHRIVGRCREEFWICRNKYCGEPAACRDGKDFRTCGNKGSGQPNAGSSGKGFRIREDKGSGKADDGRSSQSFRIRGDNRLFTETVPEEWIIGRLIEVLAPDGTTMMDEARIRKAGRRLRLTYPLRFLTVKSRNLLRKIKKQLQAIDRSRKGSVKTVSLIKACGSRRTEAHRKEKKSGNGNQKIFGLYSEAETENGRYLVRLLSALLRADRNGNADSLEADDAAKLSQIPDNVTADSLCKLAGIQSVSVMLAEGIRRLPEAVRIRLSDGLSDEKIGSSLIYREKHRRQFAYMLEEQTAAAIYEGFDKAGIEYIPLKGLVLRSMYPRGDYRQMSDLDILVREENTMKAAGIIEGLGFAMSDSLSEHHVILKGSSGITVELHRGLFDDESYESCFSGIWEKTKTAESACIAGIPVPAVNTNMTSSESGPAAASSACIADVPSPAGRTETTLQEDTKGSAAAGFCGRRDLSCEDFYLYHMAHLAEHFTGSGSGIRPVMDLQMILQKYAGKLDWGCIDAKLGELGITQLHAYSRRFCAEYFGETEYHNEAAEGCCSRERAGECIDENAAGHVSYASGNKESASDRRKNESGCMAYTSDYMEYTSGYRKYTPDEEEGYAEFCDTVFVSGATGLRDVELRRKLKESSKGRPAAAGRLMYIFRRMFPPVGELTVDYPVLKRFPVLAPGVYIHRMLRTIVHNRARIQEELKSMKHR